MGTIKESGRLPYKGKRILIVEDSQTQISIIKKHLSEFDFYFEEAKTGVEGLEKARRSSFDLIISDIEMPEMNGYELCLLLKRNPDHVSTPFVLLTSLDDASAIIEGIAVGADNYLTKPYTKEALTEMVKEMLSARVLPSFTKKSEVVRVNGKEYEIFVSKEHILNFLLNTYENVLQQNRQLKRMHETLSDLTDQLQYSRQEMHKLLLNIMPEEVAESLLAQGYVDPIKVDNVSVMFTDFVHFTKVAEAMSANDLLSTLEIYFDEFDRIAERYGLEKIKTIGDSYMFASGVPQPRRTHALDCVCAAFEILNFVKERKQNAGGKPAWDIRIGINSGGAVAGVIGTKRYAFDIWGSTVNKASRMESNSKSATITVSEDTYTLIKRFFECKPSGIFDNGRENPIPMYAVLGFAPIFADGSPSKPNEAFFKVYNSLNT